MNQKHFHFSESLITTIINYAEGIINPADFDKIIAQLENESTKYYFNFTSEANLLRVLASLFDRVTFLKELLYYPHHSEILIAIVSNSNYLTDIVVRNPEYLYQIFDEQYLSKDLDLDELQTELLSGINRFKNFSTKLNYIRQFKKRIILKIGVLDILGIKELKEITQQLSILATAINSSLFQLCYNETIFKHGINSIKNKYVLCSLGKHGGNELNYSSDVDLILFYDINSTFSKQKKDFHELLTETAQLFTKSSTEISSNGFIYRVDFRLRPDGKFSPLCKTMNDYIKYYETRGEDWEKQMLIKLNFITGDNKLYQQFLTFVTSYIYHSNYSHSIKDKIKLMKVNIEKQHNNKDDVKTFAGGIRDIEFAIQSMQLLNGNKIKELRTGNTLTALNILNNKQLISNKEFVQLNDAYIFYRKVEHFLQLMNDTQTHSLPTDLELLTKLSNSLKFKSTADFSDYIIKLREKVRTLYNKILSTESTLEHSTKEELVFADANKARKNFEFLRTGQGVIERKEFDSRTIQLFESIEITLFTFLSNTKFCDKVLDNFAKVIRSTSYPSIWYSELLNKKFFENFLTICLCSQKSIDLLCNSQPLQDYFLSRRVFIKDIENEFSNLSTDEIVFTLSVQFTLGLISQKQVSELFGNYFSYRIKGIIEKYNIKCEFFLAALGSFGSLSMTFASDIDLVVVVDKINIEQNLQTEFQNFLIEAKKEFKPFDVDFRLRPEGKKSPLVWDYENYASYLSSRARIWEFQSLTKLRLIYGSKNLYSNFTKLITSKIKNYSKDDISKEILKMHSVLTQQVPINAGNSFNLKKARGGLHTIDFIIQYKLLTNPLILLKSFGIVYKKMFSALKGQINKKQLDSLHDAFLFIKKLEMANQIIFNGSQSIIADAKDKKEIISQFLEMKSPEELNTKISLVFKNNFTSFNSLLGE